MNDMTVPAMKKMPPRPVGQEISFDVGKFKKLAAYKVGDNVTIEIEGTIMGHHMHSIGRKTEKMMDIEIEDCEIVGDDAAEDAGEGEQDDAQ